LERRYPTFGNLVPRDVASRAAKKECDEGKGIAMSKKGYGVFLDFASAIERYGKIEANKRGVGADNASSTQVQEWGAEVVKTKYGNLFEMYERISGDNPYETPMRIYPAPHYTMGGLWVDYNLQSNIPGLFVAGEANFSDHGANRLGASALMQGLADGYFVLPYTIGHYLAQTTPGFTDTERTEFKDSMNSVSERLEKILSIKGNKSCDEFHRELGYLMLDQVGVARSTETLELAIKRIKEIRADFWENVSVPGTANGINQSLEKAARVAEFLEFAEVMAFDALERTESCGGHFRLESQTEEGEALRKDDEYSYVAAWQYNGENEAPTCHKEDLSFQYVLPSQRSYK